MRKKITKEEFDSYAWLIAIGSALLFVYLMLTLLIYVSLYIDGAYFYSLSGREKVMFSFYDLRYWKVTASIPLICLIYWLIRPTE